MHTINLTQRFLANQPWKNPHGENQSERGEIFIILQQSTGQKKWWKIQLISTGKLFLKVWKCAQQTQPYTLLLFSVQKITCKCPAITGRHLLENCANKCSRTVAKQAVLLPRILCQKLQTVHTGRTSISVLKFNAVRTAFNAGRTDPQNLDFCAENLMQIVQH